MKRYITSFVFIFLFTTSFSQQKGISVTAFANTGFMLQDGPNYSAGFGGGLQVGIGGKNGLWMLEGSVTSFARKGFSYGASRINLTAIGAGYKLYAGKLMYGLISGGLLIDTRSNNTSSSGYFFGAGVGARPQLGRGNLDLFGRINLRPGNTGPPSYIMIGVGYAYPFASKRK